MVATMKMMPAIFIGLLSWPGALVAEDIRVPEHHDTLQAAIDASGAGDTIQERTIDAHIRTVRRKLGEAGRYLVTVWGIGYKFTVDPEA